MFADLSDAPAALRPILRRIQPATVVPFERRSVDLFNDRFEVKLYGEGTIRGVGGLAIIGEGCETTVRGLFAVGNAATRELVSADGSVNSAWALTSGLAAGEAAAALGRQEGRRAGEESRPIGAAGLRARRRPGAIDPREAIARAAEPIGIHLRADAPQTEPALTRRRRFGGLESVWTRLEPAEQLEAAA